MGPSLSWAASSGSLGALGVRARALLRRVLRPYLVRQREWEYLVVEQLRQDRDALRRQADRIEELEATVEELRSRLGAERAAD